jgi:hypothetical protein
MKLGGDFLCGSAKSGAGTGQASEALHEYASAIQSAGTEASGREIAKVERLPATLALHEAAGRAALCVLVSAWQRGRVSGY